ncbi:Na(+)/H(+) exchange regulatory cofactor NHE-RF2-like protein [Lates japonicus]|uniref:Na(+)/H(+) exchange regulatory cofactor NHE-RF2-like protein n=1 Tax=Lates japonicus TaxID=270547 RepID=A0AAD3RG31_LATJO|nr:Na(+)/H(+) exchange regulatory cofactor NHE-RF2-like protein [Lates japonicus]
MAKKGKSGRFIPQSGAWFSAEASGLHAEDRVVAVDGVSIEETHHQVVQRIKTIDHETRLLVVDHGRAKVSQPRPHSPQRRWPFWDGTPPHPPGNTTRPLRSSVPSSPAEAGGSSVSSSGGRASSQVKPTRRW